MSPAVLERNAVIQIILLPPAYVPSHYYHPSISKKRSNTFHYFIEVQEAKQNDKWFLAHV